jgi:hypothetical protein
MRSVLNFLSDVRDIHTTAILRTPPEKEQSNQPDLEINHHLLQDCLIFQKIVIHDGFRTKCQNGYRYDIFSCLL